MRGWGDPSRAPEAMTQPFNTVRPGHNLTGFQSGDRVNSRLRAGMIGRQKYQDRGNGDYKEFP